MKNEDIKIPNPDALDKASQRIEDVVKKGPSDDFFNRIEDTDSDIKQHENDPKVAFPLDENSQTL